MHADLVRAAGLELGFEQGEILPLALQVENRVRLLAARLHHHAALAVRGGELVQRQLDVLALVDPVAVDGGQVALVGQAVAHLRVQVGQGRALLGDQEQARGLAVEAVHQFQELGLRTRRAQLLDHAIGHARAAVHGHAGRLVDDEQVRILEHDGEFRSRRGLGTGFLGQADRRNPHHVALAQAVHLVDAALVHPDFARAQDAVNMALGYAFADTQQEIVNSLTSFFFGDGHELRLECRL